MASIPPAKRFFGVPLPRKFFSRIFAYLLPRSLLLKERVISDSVSTSSSEVWWSALRKATGRKEETKESSAPHLSSSADFSEGPYSAIASSMQAASIPARVPLIRFIGARLPRPNFDRSKLPPIPQVSSPVTAASAAVGEGNETSVPQVGSTSSIGPVGKIPRGQGIPYSELPRKFWRIPISEEECLAINSGGAYGL